MQSVDLAPDEKECLQQLFFNGPTWDGDLVSKAGRATSSTCCALSIAGSHRTATT